MPGMSPNNLKPERHYLEVLRQHSEQVFIAAENAPVEGFGYFTSAEYAEKSPIDTNNPMKSKLMAMAPKDRPRMLRLMLTKMLPMMVGIGRGFKDVSAELKILTRTGKLGYQSATLMSSQPNEELWQALTDYAWEKWRVIFGFTEMPVEFIFKDKAVLFKYALVAIQEMDREKINTAPDLDAGEEVLSVYSSLGIAVNDIARWLRKQGVRCQANHPLGGLVSTVPLAGKAGMGWMGQNGLLITPQFGQRQRIAPIFVEAPIFAFTDSDEHRWIEEYCKKCMRCYKNCPTGAIYEEKQVRVEEITGFGPAKTCIDREKCFPYFNETLGCSICVKVCPFSRADGVYEKLKKKTKG
jgi:ferredoxin